MSELTAIGTTRRLQALAVMGWSLGQVSERTGLDPDYLDKIRKGSEVTLWDQEKIAALYRGAVIDPLSWCPARDEVQAQAISNGWQGPAAWDDIDHDEEPYPDHLFLVDFVIENPGLRPVELRDVAPDVLGMTKTKSKSLLQEAIRLNLLERVRRGRTTHIYAI